LGQAAVAGLEDPDFRFLTADASLPWTKLRIEASRGLALVAEAPGLGALTDKKRRYGITLLLATDVQARAA
jgi:hypothetical protein